MLDKAHRRPGQRKRLLENVMELEEQLNHIRAEQGYIGQLKAQERLRNKMREERAEYMEEVNRRGNSRRVLQLANHLSKEAKPTPKNLTSGARQWRSSKISGRGSQDVV